MIRGNNKSSSSKGATFLLRKGFLIWKKIIQEEALIHLLQPSSKWSSRRFHIHLSSKYLSFFNQFGKMTSCLQGNLYVGWAIWIPCMKNRIDKVLEESEVIEHIYEKVSFEYMKMDSCEKSPYIAVLETSKRCIW